MPTGTISRCGGSPGTTFPSTLLGLGPTGTLRGYWRLGEAATPFADTSGYSGGPTNMVLPGGTTGTPYTTQVAGLLTPSQDDGAVQFNNAGGGNFPRLQAAATLNLTGTAANMTVAALCRPIANATTFRGGVFAANSIVAGSPSYENGWSLEVLWSGSTYTARWMRAISFGVQTILTQPITAGFKHLLVATYDGATTKLYVDGLLAASAADAHALGDVPGIPNIAQSPAPFTSFLGVIDEVAIWATVLTAGNVSSLWTAAN